MFRKTLIAAAALATLAAGVPANARTQANGMQLNGFVLNGLKQNGIIINGIIINGTQLNGTAPMSRMDTSASDLGARPVHTVFPAVTHVRLVDGTLVTVR